MVAVLGVVFLSCVACFVLGALVGRDLRRLPKGDGYAKLADRIFGEHEG